MGHAYSSIIADFFARLKKIQGFNVYFLTGTDEHGQKIQRAAEQKKMDPLLFCDEISKTFRDLSQTLNLSNNDFIRTTETRHAKSVQNLWNILEKKGLNFDQIVRSINNISSTKEAINFYVKQSLKKFMIHYQLQ